MVSNSAPIWRRLAALLYDAFILLALSFAYGAVLTALAAASGHTEHQDYQPMFRGLPFQAGWIAVLCAFYCWFWRKSGQTIGMKTWKIRLISKDEGSSSPSWLQCGVRCIVAPPLVIAFGLGYLWSLIDPQKRALQDKLSFTEVVFVGEQKP